MPLRLHPFVNDHYYHVFNRGVEKRPTFTNAREYQRFLETIEYYRVVTPPIKLSRFFTLAREDRKSIISSFHNAPKFIQLHCYVLMPNHFHFLVSQVSDHGISHFMKRLGDSYTRYFNTKNERVGPLFQGQFKAVRIESNEQFLHVSRYIHLNPYTSYVVKTIEEALNYPWSSLQEYRGVKKWICTTKNILSQFKNADQYTEFLKDNADYQRKLENVKHLLFE